MQMCLKKYQSSLQVYSLGESKEDILFVYDLFIFAVGRISSQLSIISATIQSMTKASDEMLITNQLVEVDIVSLDRGSCTQVWSSFP